MGIFIEVHKSCTEMVEKKTTKPNLKESRVINIILNTDVGELNFTFIDA